jgi:hypothetical protein
MQRMALLPKEWLSLNERVKRQWVNNPMAQDQASHIATRSELLLLVRS